MGRIREIVGRFPEATPGMTDNSVAHRADAESLWPRFTKVFDLISDSIVDNPPPQGVQIEFETFNWSGVDEGIHDHRGRISGRARGMEIDIRMKGTTIDDQPRFDKNWQLGHFKEKYVAFDGVFVSTDRRNGAVKLYYENGVWQYKAFWLETQNGILRLEQVVGPDGRIFDADSLESHRGEVVIPGTQVLVSRLLDIH